MKKELEKQTKLSVEEIIDILEGRSLSQSHYPRCLLVNEIGVLMINEGDTKAREMIEKIVDGDNEIEKAIAFCFLCTIEPRDNEALQKIQKFVNNEKNKDAVEFAISKGVLTRYS